jgi:predicted dehydrogenase
MSTGPRIALIGAGSMGALHARVLAQSDRCVLTLVVEPRSEVGRAVADRYGAGWQPALDDLTGVDAVVLAAATGVHHELAEPVLAAGVPLLIEKPVAAELAQSEALVSLAERRQVPLMCGFLERFNPAILTVLPLVDEPVHITAVRHSPYAPRIRTGVAADLLIHDVDACLRLVGAQPVAASGGLGFFHPESADGAEDVAEAVLTFPHGAIATASASRIGQHKVRRLTIGEVHRTIELDLLRRDVTIYRHVANSAATEDGLGYRQQTVIEIPELVSAREPLAAQLDRFLDLVDDRVDLKQERESILPAHRIVDQITRSSPAPAGTR